jgi:threonine dehydrogenase-like Zn-dependent dehydrogenase
MKTMQALQWKNQLLQVNEVPVPVPAPGEAVIRVIKAGICNTDLEIIRGYYPFSGTLGHEFVGEVVEAPDNKLVGKRVVSDINASCHQCRLCLAGHPHHCLNRSALGIKARDGAFAEYLTMPTHNLVVLPDMVTDNQAAFAEPLAAALEIQEQIAFKQADPVAVIGDGKLGLLIAASLAEARLNVTLIGHHPERANVLPHPVDNYLTTLPDSQFQFVVEATGSPSGFADAMALTSPRGTLVLKSTYKAPLEFNPSPLVVNEITLIGSRCGPMDKAVDLMASQTLDPARLVQAEYPLNQGVEAIQRASSPGTLKVLLAMN